MATSGPNYAGTAVSLANAGTSESSDNWLNPTNVGSDNATEATIVAATYDSPDISELLVCSNFAFSLSAAIIDGITVEIDRRSIIASSGKDFRVQLAKGTTFASLVGTNKAVPATIWPTSSTVATYGGVADLWGTTWTEAEVESSSFAVMISCQANIANADVGIDFVRVTITYHENLARTATATLTGGGVVTSSYTAVGTTQYTQLFPLAAAPFPELDAKLRWNAGAGYPRISDGVGMAFHPRLLQAARGSSSSNVGVATVAGPTTGLEYLNASNAVVCYTAPFDADTTIVGPTDFNLWGAESDALANVAINARLMCIHADGTWEQIHRTSRTSEVVVSTTTPTLNAFTETVASFVVKKGERLALAAFADDAGTMASGFQAYFGYNGTTGVRDSNVRIPADRVIGFLTTTPAGSSVYLTDTALDLFPTVVPLLSSFTGADETPLSEGGNWAQLSSSRTALRRISNEARPNGQSASYWTAADFGPDVAMYATIATFPTSGNIELALRVREAGGANTWDGYVVRVQASSTTGLYRYTNASGTLLGATTLLTPTWGVGDKIGAQMAGSTLTLWRYASGGSAWDQVMYAIDTTYASAGKVAVLFGDGFSGAVDDLYVGTRFAEWETVFPAQREAWTSRGSGVSTTSGPTTVAGPTAGVQLRSGGTTPIEWYTRPLAATTLVAPVQTNVWARIASGAVGAPLLRLELARTEGDGTGAVVWATNGSGADNDLFLDAVDGAVVLWLTGPDLVISNGQRLRLRLYYDDPLIGGSGTTWGPNTAGHNVVVSYGSGTAAVVGDSYLTFSQTLTEYGGVEPVPPDRRMYRQLLAH